VNVQICTDAGVGLTFAHTGTMRSFHTIARVGLASLVGALATLGATRADAADAPPACDASSLTCSVGSAALKAEIKNQLPTTIDSGLMDKGLIKIRTRFTIDPVGGEPLLAIDMPKGALVQASWSEKGFVVVKPVAQQGVQGTMKVHYTLTPSLEASIYGIGVNYNASQLINKIPGAKFNYDAKAETSILPWGFQAAALKVPAPALDQSTIFSIPFSEIGVDSGIVTGTLSIQAAANPTFNYVTKDVRLDSGSVTTADGSAKLAIGDDDFLDVNAAVAGELTLGGTLDVRPIIKVDTVDGYPTFGLVKFGFNAVSRPIGGGAPMPVSFEQTQIHIPLPNVKVPSATLAMGSVKAGQKAEKSVTIDSTGELGGTLKFESSDPQFIVPSGEVRVAAKSKHDLKVVFKPSSDGAASATITVRSNDPGSPEQTFRVAANGASLDPKGEDGDDGKQPGGIMELEPPPAADGCSTAAVGTGSTSGYAAVLIGLGLAVASRRRRSR
jgi:MYXO-CTERM domain-containing protein